MKRALSFAAVIVLLFVAGCKKKEAFPQSRLFDKTYSGQSLQTVERLLQLRAGEWNVVEDDRSLSGGPEPASRLYVISKANYAAYGATGELMLTFFNDELVSTRFFVSEPREVCASVERQQNISLCGSGDAHIEPATRVWIGKDMSGKSYIGWIDKQRQNALNNWSNAKPK